MGRVLVEAAQYLLGVDAMVLQNLEHDEGVGSPVVLDDVYVGFEAEH